MIKKIQLFCGAFAITISSLCAQMDDTEPSRFGLGLNGGVTFGDLSDAYSSNIGVDLIYLYSISKRVHVGATSGYAHYFGGEVTDGLVNVEFDDLGFIPVAASMRLCPLPNLLTGGDIGYAIGVNDGNTGGFYASPRLTYFINGKIPVFAGYRLVGLEGDNLNAFQFGVGFILN